MLVAKEMITKFELGPNFEVFKSELEPNVGSFNLELDRLFFFCFSFLPVMLNSKFDNQTKHKTRKKQKTVTNF